MVVCTRAQANRETSIQGHVHLICPTVTPQTGRKTSPSVKDELQQNCSSASKNSPTPSSSSTRTIFTIGHGNRLLSNLVSILQTAQVTHVVDVRSFPSSYNNPQFNRDALASSVELGDAHIRYTWLGKGIGGRRNSKQPGVERHTALRVAAFRNYAGYMGTDDFKQGLKELEIMASEEQVAIMCSETLWWRCHRRMISDLLITQGWEVRHLGVNKEASVHTMWEIARVEADGLVYDIAS